MWWVARREVWKQPILHKWQDDPIRVSDRSECLTSCSYWIQWSVKSHMMKDLLDAGRRMHDCNHQRRPATSKFYSASNLNLPLHLLNCDVGRDCVVVITFCGDVLGLQYDTRVFSSNMPHLQSIPAINQVEVTTDRPRCWTSSIIGSPREEIHVACLAGMTFIANRAQSPKTNIHERASSVLWSTPYLYNSSPPYNK